MRLPQRLALLLAALLLTACEQVRFEQIPGGPYRACEPVWVGDWAMTDIDVESTSTTDTSVLRVDDDCTSFHVLTIKDGAWIREERYPDDEVGIVFSNTSKHRVLGFVSTEINAAEEKDPVLAAVWTLQSDSIDIALPDAQKSAELLVRSTAYSGTVTRRRLSDVKSRNGFGHHALNVYFSGTSEDLARLLDQEEILDTPSLRLTRIPAEERARLDPLLRAAIEAADQADVAE